jgi:peptidoglycan hydrolase-like protein with peptidoglycan-binding domain
VPKRVSRQTALAAGHDEAGRLAGAIAAHPREFVGVVLAAGATLAIFVNALFLQHGPHPAPLFATRPYVASQRPAAPSTAQAAADAAAHARAQLISGIQTELTKRGFYDAPVDGVWGAKTDTAVRDFIQAAGLNIKPEANDAMLRAITGSKVKAAPANPIPQAAHNDPIAELLAPSKRVLAIQRALADFGYGQIKPTGIFDPDTRTAIEKFERAHQMPVTGQISEPLVRELAAMTGRPLE